MWTILINLLKSNKGHSAIWVSVLSILGLVYSGTPPFESAKPVHAGELKQIIEPMQRLQKNHTDQIFSMRETQLMEAIWRQEDRLQVKPDDAVAKDRLRRLKLKLDKLHREGE